MKFNLTSPLWTWSTSLLAVLFICWSILLQSDFSPDLAGKWLQLNILVLVSCVLALGVAVLLSLYQRNTVRHVRMEAALRDSEALYHSLVESLPQNILRKDLEGRFTFGNQRFCAMLGKRLDDIVGKTDFDFFPEELAAKYRRDDAQVMQTGNPLETIEEHVPPGGTKLYVQVVKTPVYDARGVLLGTQGIFWDVTERERAKEELIHQRYLLDALMNNVPDTIYFKDRGGRFLRVNQAKAGRLGLSDPAAALGKTDFDYYTPAFAQQAYADELAVMETGRPMVGREEKIVWPDGRELWVTATKMPLRDPNGTIIGTFGISRDITERKKAEESLRASERRYRQLTEASQDAIVVGDQLGRITLFNPAAEKLFGYAAAEVVGQPLACLMPAEFGERHEDGFRRYLQTRMPHIVGRTVELCGRRKEGSEFPMEMSLSAIDLGGELQFLGAIRDLSERNRMRALLVQSEKLASIGVLSAGIAHEINNPLAFVANNLVVLEKDTKGLLSILAIYEETRPHLAPVEPDAERRLQALAEEIDLPYIKENLGRILARTRDGVQRVARIVQSLRGLARTSPAALQEVQLTDLVESSLDMIRGRLRNRDINVELDYGLAPKLRCVPTQIGQVLLNLLVNAVQAIESSGRAKGGHIRLATRREDEEVLIEVADNGCGIAPEDLPRLYDPFFTTKPVGEGTGLGLSITHSIIAGHSGRIEVESQPGEGTCFRIRLPLDPKRGLA
jgi:PAS domain S-box-containing protein